MQPDPRHVLATAAVALAIDSVKYRYVTEHDLHNSVETVLEQHAYTVLREHHIPGGRLDLYLPDQRIAVEIKTSSTGFRPMLRQVATYALDPTVDGVVLVTNRARHAEMPSTIEGVPVEVVVAW